MRNCKIQEKRDEEACNSIGEEIGMKKCEILGK
jgi:hypothetical protein